MDVIFRFKSGFKNISRFPSYVVFALPFIEKMKYISRKRLKLADIENAVLTI